jgi:ABC-2 type transport system ATP-binding protein
MSFAIEIRDIRKKYKGAWTSALDGFSFHVNQHEVTGLLGPNGAGKTTCISILCGLVKPDSGSAFISGKDCIKDIASIRSVIGMVPQQIALFGNLTASENFRYIGRLYGLPEDVINKRSKNLLLRLGLDSHADKRINAYSGGMKRRANIIASLLHEPELLILDEPTAGVDVQSRAMILDFLKEYRLQGKTILYTSHLLDEAEQICDEVTIIDEGKFVVSGTPNDLIRDTAGCKRLEDVFLHYTGRSARDS